MPDFIILGSLSEIESARWNECFVGEVEDYAYLLAVEESGISGFTWAYATVWDGDILLAAMPAFITEYGLDTTLQGTGKKIATAVSKLFPRLLKIKLACLGSPCTEAGIVGFHPRMIDSEKPLLLQTMIVEFERFAASQGCALLGIKDIPETMQMLWNSVTKKTGYAELSGLPAAYLDIDFVTMDDYMMRLSASTRKNMRRKLKAAQVIEIRTVQSLDGILPEMMALYNDTTRRSEWKFETLPEAYFQLLFQYKPAQSFCNLYYADEQLLAANILIYNQHTLIDHIFCMNGAAGKDYNLYFLSWFQNIKTCLDKGFTHYQCGQMNYAEKTRLGSKLIGHMMYFKHRNPLVQCLFKLVSPLFSAGAQ